jgi:hypothetical protein
LIFIFQWVDLAHLRKNGLDGLPSKGSMTYRGRSEQGLHPEFGALQRSRLAATLRGPQLVVVQLRIPCYYGDLDEFQIGFR